MFWQTVAGFLFIIVPKGSTSNDKVIYAIKDTALTIDLVDQV